MNGFSNEQKRNIFPDFCSKSEDLCSTRGRAVGVLCLYLELNAVQREESVEISTTDGANPRKPELMDDFLLFQQWKDACRGSKPSCPRKQLCRCWWSGTMPTTPREGPATTRSGIYLSPVSWTWWVTTLRGSAGHGMWANSFFTSSFQACFTLCLSWETFIIKINDEDLAPAHTWHWCITFGSSLPY